MEAPFRVPVDMSIAAFEFSAVAAGTATLGVFESGDLVNPLYSISIVTGATVTELDLNVLLTKGWQLSFRITAVSGTLNKPRMAMYIAGR